MSHSFPRRRFRFSTFTSAMRRPPAGPPKSHISCRRPTGWPQACIVPGDADRLRPLAESHSAGTGVLALRKFADAALEAPAARAASWTRWTWRAGHPLHLPLPPCRPASLRCSPTSPRLAPQAGRLSSLSIGRERSSSGRSLRPGYPVAGTHRGRRMGHPGRARSPNATCCSDPTTRRLKPLAQGPKAEPRRPSSRRGSPTYLTIKPWAPFCAWRPLRVSMNG